jgi:hypothetical protein
MIDGRTRPKVLKGAATRPPLRRSSASVEARPAPLQRTWRPPSDAEQFTAASQPYCEAPSKQHSARRQGAAPSTTPFAGWNSVHDGSPDE